MITAVANFTVLAVKTAFKALVLVAIIGALAIIVFSPSSPKMASQAQYQAQHTLHLMPAKKAPQNWTSNLTPAEKQQAHQLASFAIACTQGQTQFSLYASNHNESLQHLANACISAGYGTK